MTIPQKFIEAIRLSALPRVASLVAQHGLNHSLVLPVLPRQPMAREVVGNPLAIAAYLKQEPVALFLLALGALPQSAIYQEDSPASWSRCSVSLLEIATANKMDLLSIALMSHPSAANWSARDIYDNESFCAPKRTEPLIARLESNAQMLEYLEGLGHFGGELEGHPVLLTRTKEGFEVFVSNIRLCSVATMKQGLHVLRKRIALLGPALPAREDTGHPEMDEALSKIA